MHEVCSYPRCALENPSGFGLAFSPFQGLHPWLFRENAPGIQMRAVPCQQGDLVMPPAFGARWGRWGAL